VAPSTQPPAETLVARSDATVELLVDHPSIAASAARFSGGEPMPPRASTRFFNIHAPSCGFGDYLRGQNPGFDQHEPPPGGGVDPASVVVRSLRMGA
jgi:hypothetical protein